MILALALPMNLKAMFVLRMLRPHPGPLPQERENRLPRLGKINALAPLRERTFPCHASGGCRTLGMIPALVIPKTRQRPLLLPGGEGRDEGELSSH